MIRKTRWLAGALLAGWGVGLLIAESRWPLRPVRVAKASRDARNAVFAVLSALTVALLQDPLVQPLARRAQARRWGLLGHVRLPRGLETAAAVLLMDYTLYVWHVLTHRVPLLWRFHRPHHADLEMDASTALRFHFGEMALSAPYRAAQIALIGAGPAALTLWQRLTLASILFHHSNLQLPAALDRVLARFVVTPSLHEIHHSTYHPERNTNWSSGLALWDRLHGTYQPAHLAAETTIGDPELRNPAALNTCAMLAAPFRRDKPTRRRVTANG